MELERVLLHADIIYVGGGNTLRMMKRWRATGVDRIIRRVYEENVILSGVSAGAICWFAWGCSDSWRCQNPEAPYIRVRGLGWFPALLCPHYDTQPDRASDLNHIMLRTPETGITLDDCSALKIIDKRYRVLTSKKNSHVRKIYWKDGKFRKSILEQQKTFLPLSSLFERT